MLLAGNSGLKTTLSSSLTSRGRKTDSEALGLADIEGKRSIDLRCYLLTRLLLTASTDAGRALPRLRSRGRAALLAAFFSG